MKSCTKYDLDPEKFDQGKICETSNKENWPKYAWILCTGHNLLLGGQAKGQIHVISYNFVSNCHKDFKLGLYFSLWKGASNMTLTLTLKSSTKVKNLETSIKEN